MAAEPIRHVIVAGGGLVAWSAAAALKRRIPHLAVAMVAIPQSLQIAERIPATLPSILDFHRDLGLSDEDTILRAGSAFRLGSRLEGWSGSGSSFVHAYGEYGRPFGTSSFHLHWIGLRRAGKTAPFDRHCGSAEMGRAGRFLPPQAETQSSLGTFGFGLRLDLPRYLAMIRAYALHLGVVERRSGIAQVRLGEDGFVAALRLDDGGEAKADLFVDCTGSKALIRSALDDRWDDWSRWLPCDRLLTAETAPAPDPDPLDAVTAVDGGWRWRSEGRGATSHGLAYASAHLDEAAAARAFRAGGDGGLPAAPLAFAAGCRPQPWLRNCVALGDSAVTVEPLEWTNLHLAQSAIDRIVSMMPDRDCDPVELANYNREALAEAERVRDFLALHYLAAGRSEPFWREMAATEPPASLAHSLHLFRERGRLPYYEEETFARDSWLAVLLGLGILPRRTDPLTDSVPSAQAERTMAQMRAAIGAAVPNLPTQAEFLRNLTRQVPMGPDSLLRRP